MHMKKWIKLVIFNLPLRFSSSREALEICSREIHSNGIIQKRNLSEDTDLLNCLSSLHEETESSVKKEQVATLPESLCPSSSGSHFE